jgi:hypothetical protein
LVEPPESPPPLNASNGEERRGLSSTWLSVYGDGRMPTIRTTEV